MPKVSVILTSYNHDKYINEAIDSVLKQTFTDFELIIWDDASIDHSWYLINQYTDSRIKAFRNDVNQGPVFGVNKIISEIATGDFIAMHHSDDVWEAHKLQQQVDFLETHSEIGAIFSNALAINQEGLPLVDEQHFYAHIFDKTNRTRYEWLRFFFSEGNALCHPSLLIRKQCYQDCGLYRSMLAQVPDFDMWIRLCLKYEIYVLPEKLVRFRVRDNEANTSGNRPETRIRGLYEYYKLLNNYQTISSLDELIKIFPSAQKYYRTEATDSNFVLAMVALEEKPFPFTELFGQEVLFEAISDTNRAAHLKQVYNFDYHSFIELTAKHDVFSREEIANIWQDMATLNNRIAERETAIATLNKVVAQREDTLATLNQVVIDRDDLIVTLNQALVERDEQLNQALVERDEQLNQALVEFNKVIAEHNERFHQALVEHENKLTAVRNSSSWKITAPIRFLGHLVNGNFNIAFQVINNAMQRLLKPLLTRTQQIVINQLLIAQNYALEQCTRASTIPEINNDEAINAIVRQRCSLTQDALTVESLSCITPKLLPTVDISVVTYNSSRWLDNFIDSLIKLDYPKNLLSIRFVDNSSTDSTLNDLHKIAPILRTVGCNVEILKRPNNGYGAGHNAAIQLGIAPFCLVTNVDLTFETDALSRLIAVAEADNEKIATWEMRQKPYEHPKYYDPITGLTNWNSHACVLLRRSALNQVGFYDDTLFMYGEDVELSYRLRQAGFLLRYCPQAVVWHYSYEDITQVKPLQYTGSTFANLYLRLKYGTPAEAKDVPWLALSLLLVEAYPGSRLAVAGKLLRLLLVTPKALLDRQSSQIHFPFRAWDYELIREGAFLEQKALPISAPLVSIITRTYRGRELYLRQALLSVAHQSYPNIEYIVVEDGGNTMQAVVENINHVTKQNIRFIALPKLGRSATGNAGLSAATGHWCLFLDDDDLLFADHVETLVNAILEQPDLVAAYSPAWEIITDSSKFQEGEYAELSHKTPEALYQDFDIEVLKHHNCMAIQSVLFERRLFEERGGFEENMDALEDWLLWLKYAIGNRFKYVPKVTSMFRTPANPIVTAKRNEALHTAYTSAQQKLSIYLQAFNNESE
jgi:glycosyltransferase involved in cell wall biosynthesis